MKRIVLFVLVLTGLWGCTQSELVSHEDDQIEMRLKSTALSVESLTKNDTRAAFEGTISSDNSLTARVLVSKTDGNYTTNYLLVDDDMTFTIDGGTTPVGFDPPQYYPADNNDIYLCGLYPSTGWDADQTTTASFTFHGNEDVMVASQVSSNKKDAKNEIYKTLNFNHLLTLLVINVVAENDAAITTWGNLQGITLSKVGENNPNSTVKITLKTGVVAENGFSSPIDDNSFKFWICNPVLDVEAAFADQSQALTKAVAEVAYSMVCPVTADGTEDYTLSVITEKGGTVSVPVNLKATGGSTTYTGDTQGQKFVITLTFKATEIQALGAVTDWVDAGESNETIQ